MYRLFLLSILLFCIDNVSLASPVHEDESLSYFADRDRDGVSDYWDNCPNRYNPSQHDSDGDGIGDVCDDDDCDCTSKHQMIYVCQDGMTRRVYCSALSDPNTYCGPCEEQKKTCGSCEEDEDGKVTICLISHSAMRNVKGTCEQLERYFNEDGSLKGQNQCGPCNCEMIGDKDSDGDGRCDKFDECPDNPNKTEAGMCGCDKYDSDNDWVCDDEDICPGGNDKHDADGDGVPDFCDKCPGSDDNRDWDYDGIPDGCDECPDSATGDSDGDGVCDDEDICPGGDDNLDANNNGTPDFCERTKCAVRGNSEYEWIDDVKINDWYNKTGDNGGYAQFEHPSLMFFPGDSLDLWMTPGYIDQICELSFAIFIDWNGDLDFDDAEERVYDFRGLVEKGRGLRIPDFVQPGKICIRFIAAYGRISSACDPCIDGEVEDYTIMIKDRSCDQTEETFDYSLDSPLQGLDEGWGWNGPWRAMVSGNPKSRILQGSLSASNAETNGHKLGVLTYPGTNYMILREFNIDNEDIWMSFIYLKRGGTGTLDVMIGENDERVSIDGNGVLSVGSVEGPALPEGVPSYIVLRISQATSGHQIQAWVNPSASNDLNPNIATTLENVNLTGGIDHVIFSFYGTDNSQATDHYIDEIRVGCTEESVVISDRGGVGPSVVDMSLTVAPNPLTLGANAGITLANATFFQGTLNLYSMSGALVLTQPAVAGLNVVATSGLQPGVYVLEIVTDIGTITESIVIQS